VIPTSYRENAEDADDQNPNAHHLTLNMNQPPSRRLILPDFGVHIRARSFRGRQRSAGARDGQAETRARRTAHLRLPFSGNRGEMKDVR
jgi:hypothetical protein